MKNAWNLLINWTIDQLFNSTSIILQYFAHAFSMQHYLVIRNWNTTIFNLLAYALLSLILSLILQVLVNNTYLQLVEGTIKKRT